MACHHLAQLWQETDFHPRATTLCLPRTSPAVSTALICLLPGNWQVMRRELPPGATVLQGQCCNFFSKRENGQAGSFTAMDEILGMSPPVYFTARLHCSIPCGKQHRLAQHKENQTLGCWQDSDTPRTLHMHLERDKLATDGINWVLSSSTGPPHGLALFTSAFFAQCSGVAS